MQCLDNDDDDNETMAPRRWRRRVRSAATDPAPVPAVPNSRTAEMISARQQMRKGKQNPPLKTGGGRVPAGTKNNPKIFCQSRENTREIRISFAQPCSPDTPYSRGLKAFSKWLCHTIPEGFKDKKCYSICRCPFARLDIPRNKSSNLFPCPMWKVKQCWFEPHWN